ncbi:MAG: P-loop NTPase [Candidatus Nitrotoga sp.]
MRSNIGIDQAEGLRRILVRNQTQVITVVAGKSGIGRTSTTINLAAALAHIGKDVLVLDENNTPDNLLDRLGLHARYDLLDAAQGKCAPKEAVLVTNGFSVLHTARAMSKFPMLDQAGQQRLEDALTAVNGGVDVMLVNTVMPVLSKAEGWVGQTTISSSMASGAALLVVVDATASGITESYALIKRLVLENARSRFEILVNKVGGEQAALRVFENMAKVARRNLAARLEYLGYIPRDDKLKHAAQLGKPVIEMFPNAVSAKLYMESAQKLLCLPIQQDGDKCGTPCVIQKLIKQLARKNSRAIAYVAN